MEGSYELVLCYGPCPLDLYKCNSVVLNANLSLVQVLPVQVPNVFTDLYFYCVLTAKNSTYKIIEVKNTEPTDLLCA